jgi:hypothetical protein
MQQTDGSKLNFGANKGWNKTMESSFVGKAPGAESAQY